MKIKMKSLILSISIFILLCNALTAQKKPATEDGNGREYKVLNDRLSKGWNTWDTKSVLSHVLLPESFAINFQLIDHQTGDTLKEALIGREDFGTKEHVIPGLHAYDGSYTELVVEWHKIQVKVQSSAKNGQLYLLIKPIQYSSGDSIIVDPKMLWGRKGEISINKGNIMAKTSSGTINVALIGGRYTSKQDHIKISMLETTTLSTDLLKSSQEVEKIINDARENFIVGKSKYKDVSELYNAMQTALSWNVIYEPTKGRVITPVSRLWNVGWKGWVLFEWDTYFAAYMLSLDNKELAYANAIAMTKEITKDGFEK